MKTHEEILEEVQRGLEAQFDIYSWEDMLSDLGTLTKKEQMWANENISYKAYIMKGAK